MVKKLALTSLMYRVRDTANTKPCHTSLSPPPAWPWPSCIQPNTPSFRKNVTRDHTEDQNEAHKVMDVPYSQSQCSSSDSCLSNSSAVNSERLSATKDTTAEDDAMEAIIRGLRSDRLFYEPAGSTSSIVGEAASKSSAASDGEGVPFEGSIAMAMDSEDPYRDFKTSMEEMVMVHGVKSWEWLEEMLAWYLSANGKSNHGVIVGAFLDLLVSIASASSSSMSTSLASSCATFEIEEDEGVVDDHQP